MRRCLLAVVILGFVALVQPANAAEPRVALVIGNSAYAVAPLANPANDARLMTATLRNLGFEVMERIDADQKTMKYAIIEFGEHGDGIGHTDVSLRSEDVPVVGFAFGVDFEIAISVGQDTHPDASLGILENASSLPLP